MVEQVGRGVSARRVLGAELLLVSAASMDLLNKYLERKILGPKFQNDMLHIALATIANVDVLVSWNFRHIVRLDKIRLFNSVTIDVARVIPL